MLMMRPAPEALRCGHAACVTLKVPRICTSIWPTAARQPASIATREIGLANEQGNRYGVGSSTSKDQSREARWHRRRVREKPAKPRRRIGRSTSAWGRTSGGFVHDVL
jgi:hypothetical protein